MGPQDWYQGDFAGDVSAIFVPDEVKLIQSKYFLLPCCWGKIYAALQTMQYSSRRGIPDPHCLVT